MGNTQLKKLDVIINGNSKVLSGRREGRIMRDKLKLDDRDMDNNSYEVILPDVMAITASYFLECFGKSVRTLGKNEFINKYIFKSKKEVLNENIKSGIEAALTIQMPF